MKINDVLIHNWDEPGKEWWDGVEAKPDEPLIEATMKLTLSWREYHKMLDENKASREVDYWRHILAVASLKHPASSPCPFSQPDDLYKA